MQVHNLPVHTRGNSLFCLYLKDKLPSFLRLVHKNHLKVPSIIIKYYIILITNDATFVRSYECFFLKENTIIDILPDYT